MIKIIDDYDQILALHNKFQKKLDKFLNSEIECSVGYPSGSFKDVVKYSPELDIWISTKTHDTKYWNGFGVGQPLHDKNNSLNGEINLPIEGISRRVAGAFGVEYNGTILVLHRGKIGGGTKGIGKHFFVDNFRGDFVNAKDGDRESKFCVVGELGSLHFPKQVADFIKEIYRVKKLIKNPELNNFDFLNDFSFTSEHSGNSQPESKGKKTVERTHGIIVNALAEELKCLGFSVANDRNRDLFTYEKNKIKNLFEIKTNCSTQSLYSALGQLLIYSIPIPNKVNLYMVLPNKLKKQVLKKLTELGIEVIYFEWNNDKLRFNELNKYIGRNGYNENP